MGWFTKLGMRLRALRHGDEVHREIAEEWQFHIDLRTEENIRRGMTPEEARQSAEQHFGNSAYIKDVSWDVRGGGLVERLWHDIRYALRMLRKNPAFSALVIVTLGLGIGANTTMFSIINAVLLRPLPYATADRVMMLYESNPVRGFPQFSVSPANYVDLRAQNGSFDGMAAFTGDWFSFSSGTSAERIMGMEVTSEFFQILQVNPVLGRAFVPEEFQPGRSNVALISYGFWQSAFAGKPDAIGRSVTLNGTPASVVGILPKGFDFEESNSKVWMPLVLTPQDLSHRGAHYLNVLGLRKAEVAPRQADADLAGITRHLAAEYPITNENWTAYAVSLREDIAGEVKPALLVLLGAVGLVLLIACANTANMLLVRASARRREIAVRTAIGASRGRIIGQLLTESMVLALAGGIAGLLFALLAVDIVRALPASYLPMASSVNLDGRVLLFTLGAAVLTAVMVGLAPALLAARTDVHETLQETARSLGSRTSAGLRGVLIVSEVAFSLVLLVGAGLLLRSFSALYSTSTGFRTDHALTFMLNIPDSRYAKPEQQAEFFRQVEERMRALPGVEDVGMTSLLPLSGHFSSYSFNLANVAETESNPSIDYAVVNDDYFRVMGIPLLAGRLFTPQDRVGSPGVCLLNERAARALFPKGDAIGQHIQIGRQHDAVREIVGIVGTIKDRSVSQNPRNEGYEPLAQRPDTDISVVLRSRGDPAQLAAGVRQQIRALDAQQPVAEVFTLDEVIAKSVSLPRFRTVLLGAFAGLGLVLASVGLYGVLSYSVTQRTHEIGIRIALGAQRSRIYNNVIARGMLLVGMGSAIGLVGAILLTRFIATFLYGVTPRDPATLAEVVVVFAVVAVPACWIPARRAMRVDPMVALRHE